MRHRESQVGNTGFEVVHEAGDHQADDSVEWRAQLMAHIAWWTPERTRRIGSTRSDLDSLRGRIGVAAGLTVIEATRDGKPRFTTYHPFQDGDASVAGRPPVRSLVEGAPEALEAAE